MKIRTRPQNAIDVVLRRAAVAGGLSLFFVPDLPGLVISSGYGRGMPTPSAVLLCLRHRSQGVPPTRNLLK